jgi:hypothetical protein
MDHIQEAGDAAAPLRVSPWKMRFVSSKISGFSKNGATSSCNDSIATASSSGTGM